ncbi:MAG: hypothetical protein LCH61_14305 [Proteobacteria bacterium]|nr:hypothetical protein [Pseudomonadota bacterium]
MRAVTILVPILVLGLAGPAMAQQRKASAKPPAAITVSNARAASLVTLALMKADGKIVARLAKPLEPGKKATLAIAKGATCALEVSATFDDEAENATQIDICKDKAIRFTD